MFSVNIQIYHPTCKVFWMTFEQLPGSRKMDEGKHVFKVGMTKVRLKTTTRSIKRKKLQCGY